MKRKLFATSAVAIAALLVLGSGRLVSNRQVAENSLDENMFDLNVEALADGEDGTPISPCYMKGSGEAKWFYSCSDATSGEMIYSCPSDMVYGSVGVPFFCRK